MNLNTFLYTYTFQLVHSLPFSVGKNVDGARIRWAFDCVQIVRLHAYLSDAI